VTVVVDVDVPNIGRELSRTLLMLAVPVADHDFRNSEILILYWVSKPNNLNLADLVQ
jgi:hypothetical protein